MTGLGICSPLVAEAWALLKGIQFGLSKGFSKFDLETDSKEIKEGITGNNIKEVIAQNILRACKLELSKVEDWSISNILREQDRVADALAGTSKGLPRGLHILEIPPNNIGFLLDDDAYGLPAWRHAIV
ncbi:PREDICTED: uncharacterized protein LOC109163531 [Ipomoea nil]|uniref:uncharacterized protein LOC109163531 n=1 Tax=Ipomoea nil TaxID=35883 RepID=UPI0009013499|nr:PREDICTED: uncharacterized protein LOC109163531 [Ipomoea nil]